jgi:hypothetical protein
MPILQPQQCDNVLFSTKIHNILSFLAADYNTNSQQTFVEFVVSHSQIDAGEFETHRLPHFEGFLDLHLQWTVIVSIEEILV